MARLDRTDMVESMEGTQTNLLEEYTNYQEYEGRVKNEYLALFLIEHGRYYNTFMTAWNILIVWCGTV